MKGGFWLLAAVAVLPACGQAQNGLGFAGLTEPVIDLVRRVQSAGVPDDRCAEKCARRGALGALERLERALKAGTPTNRLVDSLLMSALRKWGEEPGREYYDVVFDTLKGVGITFEEKGGYLTVQELSPRGLAAKDGRIAQRDQLVAINFEWLKGVSLSEVSDKLSAAKPPLLFRFCKALKPADDNQKAGAKKVQNNHQKKALGTKFKIILTSLKGMGMRLVEGQSGLEADDVETQNAAVKDVRNGDHLVGVNGISLKGLDVAGVSAAFKKAKAPYVLEFFTMRADAPKSEQDEAAEAALEAAEAALAARGGGEWRGEFGSIILTQPTILAGTKYSVQFADFGLAPPCGLVNVTAIYRNGWLASGCDFSKSPPKEELPRNMVLVVLRGECTFVQKARGVAAAGADTGTAGMLVVNRDFETMGAMPAGAGELNAGPVDITAAMIDWAQATKLLGLVKGSPLEAVFHGPNCPAFQADKAIKDSGPDYRLQPPVREGANPRERDIVENSGEFTVWSASMPEAKTFYALFSDFAPYDKMPTLATADAASLLYVPYPHTVCETIASDDPLRQSIQGAIAIVHRGGCPFAQKALNLQHANARMMIVVDINNDDPNELVLIQSADEEQQLAVKIPIASITFTTGLELREIFGMQEGEGDQKASENREMVIAKLFRKTFYLCNRNVGTICGVNEFPEEYLDPEH